MSCVAAQTSPDTCFYLGLLGINALVALTCLIAGPRVWARRLGAAFVVGNGLLVLAVTAFLTHFALTTDLHRDEAGFGFGLAVILALPIAFEFLLLLLIALVRFRLD